MRNRVLAAVLCVLALAACGGGGNQQEAVATTSTSTTSTTMPDPAVEGCKALDNDTSEAIGQLLISRDERIVAAAKAHEAADPFDSDIMEEVNALTEVRLACIAAGYLPRP
jgi:ABC-type glycerol-3-phosphate transport system substrate-binding protein